MQTLRSKQKAADAAVAKRRNDCKQRTQQCRDRARAKKEGVVLTSEPRSPFPFVSSATGVTLGTPIGTPIRNMNGCYVATPNTASSLSADDQKFRLAMAKEMRELTQSSSKEIAAGNEKIAAGNEKIAQNSDKTLACMMQLMGSEVPIASPVIPHASRTPSQLFPGTPANATVSADAVPPTSPFDARALFGISTKQNPPFSFTASATAPTATTTTTTTTTATGAPTNVPFHPFPASPFDAQGRSTGAASLKDPASYSFAPAALKDPAAYSFALRGALVPLWLVVRQLQLHLPRRW